MTTEADSEIDADRGAATGPPTPQEAKWRTFVAMLLRPHWLVMVVFARLELVQRFAGRKRSRGWPHHQVGGTESSAMVLTERAPEEIINQIGVDGVADGLRLSEEAVANVLSFAAHTPCYGNRAPDFPLEYDRFAYPIPAGAIVGDYLDAVTDCDAIRRLWQDPIIIAIAGGYLGRRPLPIKVRLWWSFSSNHASPELLAAHAQDRFHFDLDNWRAIKFFFYLTDVGPDNGPHLYVRTSHRNRSIRDQLSLSRGRGSCDIAARFGRANFAKFHGPAGTGFVEDPYGFHTGTAVTGAARLMLELEYGVSGTGVGGDVLRIMRQMA